MIPVLGIAFYNRLDLLERCLQSIDYPVNNLVVIDNSPTGEAAYLSMAARENIRTWARTFRLVRHCGANAGWAGSCNEIIKLFPAPWWLLVNNDIAFFPNDLRRTFAAAEHNPEAAALFGNHGSSWWVMTCRGASKVGLLDENFYPCYLDDCDWCYRAKLAGEKLVNIGEVNATHGDERTTGSCTIHADEDLRRQNHRTHGRNFDYYREKWGGVNDAEVFQHPFNNPALPVTFWTFRPEFRARQQWVAADGAVGTDGTHGQ